MLLLDAALAQGAQVIVAAIKEETSPLIEQRGAIAVHWLSLGELGKLIETFKRDTDSLIGAVAKVLADEGIHLISSTSYLEPLLAKPGVLTRRPPTDAEQKNIEYGRDVARHLAQYDIGQTVVIAESACVAVEAMEGTDAAILRAGEIMRSLSDDAASDTPVLSRSLTVVKVAKPNQDMRFDVPVIGAKTVETMQRAGASCLAVDAGKCLFLDGGSIVETADKAGISIVAAATE